MDHFDSSFAAVQPTDAIREYRWKSLESCSAVILFET